MGCLKLPEGCIDNCHTIHTYLLNSDTNKIDITLQSLKDWTALAFNKDPSMVR